MMGNRQLERLSELNALLEERERTFASFLKVTSMDSPSVLIVDDDANVRRTFADILRNKGYLTTAVTTGQKAIDQLQIRFYNVVLLDYMLPDLSMDDVLEVIKQRYPLTITIIVTGYSSATTAIDCASAGVNGYMVKPIDMNDLLSRIREALAQQRGLWNRLRALPVVVDNKDAK